MRITFLVRNIWGIGGTIRTTLNTAEALADRGHEVAIASCVRPKDRPDFAIDPRISVTSLLDVRAPDKGGEVLSYPDRVRRNLPSFLDRDQVNNMGESSRLLDRRVKGFVRRVDTDVLVSTQVSLNLYVARYGRRGTVKVAQEHLYLDHYTPAVRARILEAYDRFDAVVTVSEADARTYRQVMPAIADRVECIPNAIPPSRREPSPLTEPVVMAVGRLARMKGFDRLIEAFAAIAGRHPEWTLRIYGRGPHRKKLRGLVDEHGLRDRIKLMGAVAPLDDEWTRASIAAVSSRFEPFGLVIVEAMAAGLPVVCTAVDHGPLEIVEDGTNGLLTKPGSVGAFAEALERLMEDPDLRRKLAEGGLQTARRYEPDVVVVRHERLFERLLTARGD